MYPTRANYHLVLAKLEEFQEIVQDIDPNINEFIEKSKHYVKSRLFDLIQKGN